MQEARPVAGRRRLPGRVAEAGADPGHRRIALRRRGDERLEGQVGVRHRAGRGERAASSARFASAALAAGTCRGRRPRPRSALASTSRVSSLASSTLGWSNGSMPRTTPAIAVATSQRTNSAPRSIGSGTVIRMTGWPAFSSASARASRPPSVPPSRAIRTNDAVVTVGLRPRRSARGRPARCPRRACPVLSAMSCSAQAPKDTMSSSGRKVSLSRPARARVPIAMPSETPGLASGSGSRHAPSIAAADARSASRSSPISDAGTRPTYVSAL